MSFKLAKTWKDRGEQVDQIKKKCKAIICSLNVCECDARRQGMVHVRQMCNTLAAVPIKLQQNVEFASNVPVICAILGVSDAASLKRQLGDLNKNAKCSFITMVQFALENCIKNVLDALPRVKTPWGFKDCAKRILKFADLPTCGCKYHRLILPAAIRDSLHRNGVHTLDDWCVVMDGAKYEFRQDEPIYCGSWSHIVWAVLKALDVYEAIFKSEKVAAIPHIATF